MLAVVFQTEMTTAEMELDQNTNFDWNRIQESGEDIEPLFGPGYTGLVNLGNRCSFFCRLFIRITTYSLCILLLIFLVCSCYLAATMQVVFSTRSFCLRSVYVPLNNTDFVIGCSL